MTNTVGRRPRAYLVEHYWPGATVAAYEAALTRVVASISDVAARGGDVRLLHSTFIPADEAALAVLVAASRAQVAATYRAAGVPCDRIVQVVVSDPTTTTTTEDDR